MIKVTKIEEKGRNEKGITFEIENLDRTGKYILAQRNKGSISGGHYHKGISPTKNPEIVFLLQGEGVLKYKSLESSDFLELKIEALSKIEIFPNTWHELHALSDILFLELNSLKEGDLDTFKV